jgi:hypothetical protein
VDRKPEKGFSEVEEENHQDCYIYKLASAVSAAPRSGRRLKLATVRHLAAQVGARMADAASVLVSAASVATAAASVWWAGNGSEAGPPTQAGPHPGGGVSGPAAKRQAAHHGVFKCDALGAPFDRALYPNPESSDASGDASPPATTAAPLP